MANTSVLEWVLKAKDEASDTFNKVSGAAEKQEGHFNKLKVAGTVAMAGLAVAAVDFAKESVDKFQEAEESQKKLEFAYGKFPALADVNIEALRKLNSEIQKKTKYDDDDLAAGQATLAQFKLTGSQIQEVTPLLADYADRTGKDLPSAAQDLGKALLGNAKALKNIGISYKSTGDSTQDFANITQLMRDKVGGFAEQEGQTAAGKLAILKNQFGDLQEKVGGALVPALTNLLSTGIGVTNWVSNHTSLTIALVSVIGLLALGIKVAASWTEIQATAIRIATAAQWLWNAAMDANPIGLIIIAIAALVAGIVWAYQHVDWFRDGVQTAFKWVQNAISVVVDWVTAHWPLLLAILTGPIGLAVLAIATHWNAIKAGASEVISWITDKWNGLIGWFESAPGKMAAAAGGMFSGIWSAFKGAFNQIVAAWNNFHLTIGGGNILGVNIPSVTLETPNIPYLAKGGNITGGGSAVVGDAGPELLNLPQGATVTPLNGTGGMIRLHPDDLDALAGVILAGVYAGANQVTSQAQQSRVSAMTRRVR